MKTTTQTTTSGLTVKVMKNGRGSKFIFVKDSKGVEVGTGMSVGFGINWASVEPGFKLTPAQMTEVEALIAK